MTTTNPLSTLGEIIWTVSRADESTISATGANVIARAILDSDFFAAHTAAAEARGAERGARAVVEAAEKAVHEHHDALIGRGRFPERIDLCNCLGCVAYRAARDAAARVEGGA